MNDPILRCFAFNPLYFWQKFVLRRCYSYSLKFQIYFPFPVLSACSPPLVLSPVPFGPLAVSCLALPRFTLELRPRFAHPLAMCTLHPSVLTHVDTFFCLYPLPHLARFRF